MDELRTLFLFESLNDDQLAWLSDHGVAEDVPAARTSTSRVSRRRAFFVVVSGTVSMSRRVHDDDVEVVRTSQRGVYGGAIQAALGDRVPQLYPTRCTRSRT